MEVPKENPNASSTALVVADKNPPSLPFKMHALGAGRHANNMTFKVHHYSTNKELIQPKWMRKGELICSTSLSNALLCEDLVTDFPSRYTQCRKLGTGSEGYVHAWSHKITGTVFAVKAIRARESMPREVEIQKGLPPHNSIVQMYAYFQKQPRADADCMLFEFCPHGDLYDFQSLMWKKNKGIFSEACMWSIYRQLTWAIAFLHEGVGCSDPRDADIWRPIVHRDVKLENVLITDLGGKDDYSSIRIKLGDFGLSAFYDPKNTRMPGQWGTSVLWPPEQTWVGREATPAGDVWAVGCIIHEMAHNFPPVADPKLHEQHFTALADAADAGRLPSSWSNSKKQSFWAATTLRQPLPINLEPNQHVYDKRRNRPTPKYSDKLNMCLQMALAMDREMRPTAGVLKQRVEEQEAAFHWEELIKENNAIMEDMVEEASVADWFE